VTHHEIRKLVTATSLVVTMVTVIYACAAPLNPEDVKLRVATLDASSQSAINGTAGLPLSTLPQVVVKDQFSDPFPGVAVSFAASAGPQPTPTSVLTNSSGVAAPTSWTMQQTTGTVTLTATAQGLTRQFTVTIAPGAAASGAVANNSNNQSAAAGTAVAIAPQVRVADQFNNAVPGASVTFAVTAGGGSVVPATAVQSDASGMAKPTSWTLGPAVGSNTLRATINGVTTPITFTATGTAGPPASIVINPNTSSQNQSAIAGTNVAVAPSVLVRDANNNVAVGVTVRFTVTTGNGKLLASASDATGSDTFDATTDASGIASAFAWKLGAVGANVLSVTVPSVSTLAAFSINATGTVGPPTQVSTSNLPWAFVRASTQVFGSPRVLVRDVGGNPVPSATVTWAAGVNGSVSGTLTGVTNSAGVATFPGLWTAGATTSSTATLIASVQGTSLTQSFSSLITGPVASIQVSAGNGQSAAVGTAVSTRPAVLLKDAAGNPVTASNVTFAVTAGGGTLTTPTPNSDSVGVATVGNWTLGTTAGASNTMTATATSTAFTTTFTATATAGTPTSIAVNPGDNGQTAAANSTISVSAVVKDQFGNNVSGAIVTFAVTGTPSNAAVTSVNPATTNASGLATATWRLDTLARTNTLTATIPGSLTATFTATSTPLAASKLAIVQGNNQTAAASGTVPIAPQVRVTDQYNNTVFAATSVIYQTGASGGTVTNSTFCPSPVASCTVTSSVSTGIAPLTTWTLGTTGAQTLFVRLTPAGSVLATFTATIGNPCGATAHTVGTSVNGSLASSDCTENTGNITGGYLDAYSITTAAASTQFFSLKLAYTGFTPQLKQQFYSDTSRYFFVTFGTPAPATDSVYYALGPGTVRLGVTSTAGGATGSYTMTSKLNPGSPAGCGYVVSTRGMSLPSSSMAFDANCNYTPAPASGVTASRPSKVFYIIAAPNESITINMNSSAFTPRLEAYDNSVSGAGSTTPTDAAYVTSNASSGAGVATSITLSGGTTGKYFVIRATQVIGTACNTTSCTFSFSINP
jgi:adhesin/invasin